MAKTEKGRGNGANEKS